MCDSCIIESPKQQYCYSCGRILNQPKAKIRKADVIKVVAIIGVALIIAYFQTPVFPLAQGPEKVLIETSYGQQINEKLLPQIQDYTLDFLYRDNRIRATCWARLLACLHIRSGTSEKKAVFVALKLRRRLKSLHAWEGCLVTWPRTQGYQLTVTQLSLRDITIYENPPIIARFFAFQHKSNNQTQLVLYWFESVVLNISNSIQQKHVKISLIAYPGSSEDLPAMENQLLYLASEIAGYWDPIKVWSTITILLSQNSLHWQSSR